MDSGEKLGEARPISRNFIDERLQLMYLDLTRQGELFAMFSAVALFLIRLGALGLFGLAAFTAERRAWEIGISQGNGRDRGGTSWVYWLWQFAKPVLWANVIAWPVAYFVMTRWLEGFAYHIDLSPWIFVAASVLALVIAVLTVSGHALLVSRARSRIPSALTVRVEEGTDDPQLPRRRAAQSGAKPPLRRDQHRRPRGRLRRGAPDRAVRARLKLSYDRFFPDYQRIYLLEQRIKPPRTCQGIS